MDEFIQEVEEDLKRERQLELWRKYGKYAVSLALLAVIAASAVVGWRNYQQSQRYEQGLKYATALDLAGAEKTGAAMTAFGTLAAEAGAGDFVSPATRSTIPLVPPLRPITPIVKPITKVKNMILRWPYPSSGLMIAPKT